MTDQEAHDALYKMAREHVPLGGVDPPDRLAAAAGTMRDEPDPEIAATGGASPPADDAGPPPPTPAPEPPKPAAAIPAAPKKTDLSGPLGYRAPADPPFDTELAGLQQQAKDRRATAQLGQAVTDVTERPTNLLDYAERLGGGGASAPPKKSTLWQDYENEGDQAIKDLGQRRASESSMAAKSAAAAGQAENKDPNSPKAQLMRSTLVKYAPELAEQLAGKNFDEMSPIAGAPLVKWIEEQGTAQKATAATAAKETGTSSLRDAVWADTTKRSILADNGIKSRADLDKYGDEALTKYLAPTVAAASAAGVKSTEELAKEGRANTEADRRRQLELGKEIALKRWEQEHPAASPDERKEFGSALNVKSAMDNVFAAYDSKIGKPFYGDVGGGFLENMYASGKARVAAAIPNTVASSYAADTKPLAEELTKMLSGLGARPLSIEALKAMVPVAGDTPETVARKKVTMEKLIESEITNLRTAAPGLGATHPQTSAPHQGAAGTVKMRFPNGEVDDVPAHDVEEATTKHGGVRI